IKGMNFSLTQRRKDAKVRVLKVKFGNFIPQFSNAIFCIIHIIIFTHITKISDFCDLIILYQNQLS
ncbi:hypothetical protein QHH11_24970, partial [Aphanizomenon sp. PH219]|nr:hypothetical protein [Aphanizomenon sp. PH219]